ncbi:unnamed protein product [Ectocarpus sp. CCAP 1310/34]|nr:unnamed protein product [Ectocarpus sp. CCAP 1310/34]
MSIMEGAERSGVWPVVVTERHQYMVLDMRSRTTELDQGSIKFDQVSEGEASRRVTSSRHFMCKVRAHLGRCCLFPHWVGFDGVEHRRGWGSSGCFFGWLSLPRTPRVFLDSDAESFCSKLADMLTYMRRLALPPTAPSGLARISVTPARRLVVSQTKCTCGGELLPEADVNATLVTEVERRKCGTCGACAWASDNLRKTSVFNLKNYFLVKLSLLYKCFGQFIRGTTIQSFFFSHVEPLTTNVG